MLLGNAKIIYLLEENTKRQKYSTRSKSSFMRFYNDNLLVKLQAFLF